MKRVMGFILGCLVLAAGAAELKDGVYAGKAGGSKGPVRVAVTVKDGKIAEVEVTSHREGRRYERAMDQMSLRITKQNSTDVDAVSGATATSDAVKAAVKNALKQAQ